MGIWLKKEKFFVFKYLNSYDDLTRYISRIVASVIVILIVFSIRLYDYKVTWFGVDEWTGEGSSHIGHTWDELFANLERLFLESLFFSFGLLLLVFLLDYFTIGKNQKLICIKCNNTKEFDNYYKCKCGGEYYKLTDVEYYENEDEFKLLSIAIPAIEKVKMRGINYYQCLSELPNSIFCSGCLTETELNPNQQKERKYYCSKCRKEYNLTTPIEWIKGGKVLESKKIDLGFILNGVLNVSSSDQLSIFIKFQNLKELRQMENLPDKINCPNCSKKIRLHNIEKFERLFKCNHCNEELNLSFNDEKV